MEEAAGTVKAKVHSEPSDTDGCKRYHCSSNHTETKRKIAITISFKFQSVNQVIYIKIDRGNSNDKKKKETITEEKYIFNMVLHFHYNNMKMQGGVQKQTESTLLLTSHFK